MDTKSIRAFRIRYFLTDPDPTKKQKGDPDPASIGKGLISFTFQMILKNFKFFSKVALNHLKSEKKTRKINIFSLYPPDPDPWPEKRIRIRTLFNS